MPVLAPANKLPTHLLELDQALHELPIMDISSMSSSMTMDMTMDMVSAATSSAMPSATGHAMDHDMGAMGGMGNGCKISVGISLKGSHVTLLTYSQIDAMELEHHRLLYEPSLT